MKSCRLRFRVVLAALLFASLVWGFRELIFGQMPFIFRNPQEDMSFGWYVPLFSLYVLWAERKKIVASLAAPSFGGLLLALPCLFIGFIGVRGIQVRFGVLAFAGLCLALPWALFGRETAKRVLFPVLFLLFCIPLSNFLDVITVHLRLLASSSAYWIMKGIGADVMRRGTTIITGAGSFAIDVAEPCSGLRSIFALMALTAGYAYFNQPTWLRRGLLFALSVPLAVLGNVTRILSICFVGTYCSGSFAMGFYHDYSGYVVFIVAISLMVGCGELISRAFGRWSRSRRAEEKAVASRCVAEGGLRGLVLPLLLAALVLPVMYFQSVAKEPVVCEAPDVHLPEFPGFTSEEREMSEAERTILPRDTRVEKRYYVSEDGHWYLVSLVVGGKYKGSIHRPELCLPAQGFRMTDPRTLEIAGRDWRAITLDGGLGHPSLGFAYTFFNQAGFHTASHTQRIFRDVWDRSVAGRIDRWVMVTVNASRSDDAGLRAFISKLREVTK